MAALFLLVVCGNVALLMFARAATREREILVRGALGASRSRIVMQLFVEALVLSAVAAVVGLTATNLGFTWALDAMSPETEGWPFWVAGGLSTTTVTYGFLLTLLAAVVTGVVPALKVTGGNLEARLRAASTGTGSPQMGGIWTVLMVAQVGATVLFSGVAFLTQRQAAHIASTKAAFPSEEYLAVRLEMDRRTPTAAKPEPTEQEFRTNYAAAVRSLERRLAAEPTLAGVTLAERLPLMPQSYDLIEVDDAGPSSERKHRVGTSAVDVDFFEVFQTRVIEGQGFGSADWVDGGTIVVNTLFVDEVLGGRNAIGRRIRYAADPGRAVTEAGPWLEIVGIVPDLVLANTVLKLDNPAKPLVYRPLGPTTYPVHLAAHVRGHAGSFEPTLRRIAGEQSPMLRLDGLQRLDQATSSDARAWRVLADVITATSAITLFLSLAAIYAVMSYTVTRRTREIAVRVALGARAEGVVALILRKPLATVAAGAVLGCIPVGGLVAVSMRGSLADIGTATGHATLLVAHAIVMIGVCALACIGPTVRALRVEPTEALRED